MTHRCICRPQRPASVVADDLASVERRIERHGSDEIDHQRAYDAATIPFMAELAYRAWRLAVVEGDRAARLAGHLRRELREAEKREAGQVSA